MTQTKPNTMKKRKIKKDKIVHAYPGVSWLSSISIKDKEHKIVIGGFTMDGGFYLEEPYELIKEETSGFDGKTTYYNFIKSSKKMCDHEKAIRKIETDKARWERKRIKELESELKNLMKKKKMKTQLNKPEKK